MVLGPSLSEYIYLLDISVNIIMAIFKAFSRLCANGFPQSHRAVRRRVGLMWKGPGDRRVTPFFPRPSPQGLLITGGRSPITGPSFAGRCGEPSRQTPHLRREMSLRRLLDPPIKSAGDEGGVSAGSSSSASFAAAERRIQPICETAPGVGCSLHFPLDPPIKSAGNDEKRSRR